MYIEYEINEGKNKLYGFQILSYYTGNNDMTFESFDGKQTLTFKKNRIIAKVNGKIIYPEGFSISRGKEAKFFFKEDYDEFIEEFKK